MFDPKKCCCKCYIDFSAKVKVLVQSNAFVSFIVGLILLNSITLATEHYE